MISHRRYLAVLGALFAALWIALAIDPRYRTRLRGCGARSDKRSQAVPLPAKYAVMTAPPAWQRVPVFTLFWPPAAGEIASCLLGRS